MTKLRLRKGFWIILPAFVLGFFASPVKAETYITDGANDFYFQILEVSTFTVRTFAWQNSIDSMLWLYDESDQLITANDDFYGLDSRIEIILNPGTYRLRTGVCCGDPNIWYGSSYAFETNTLGYIHSSTTVPETTTTEPEIPQTTVPETTTTVLETTTTITTPEPVIPETTTSLEQTTTTIQQTTTSTTTTTVLPISTTTSVLTTTTTIPIVATTLPLIKENDLIILNNINNLNTTEVINLINNIINDGLSRDEAIVISSKPEVLNSITTEQAKEVFKSLDVANLSVEQEKQLAEALSEAPDEIKNEFEKAVDIFGEGFDEYVPTGSSIDVGARRAIIAITTVATSITMTAPSVGSSSSPTGGAGTSGDRSSNRSRRN